MVWSARTDDGGENENFCGGEEERGRMLKRRARTVRDAQPATHAELAVNGVVQCAPGRAPRSSAAAWDKKETIAW